MSDVEQSKNYRRKALFQSGYDLSWWTSSRFTTRVLADGSNLAVRWKPDGSHWTSLEFYRKSELEGALVINNGVQGQKLRVPDFDLGTGMWHMPCGFCDWKSLENPWTGIVSAGTQNHCVEHCVKHKNDLRNSLFTIRSQSVYNTFRCKMERRRFVQRFRCFPDSR